MEDLFGLIVIHMKKTNVIDTNQLIARLETSITAGCTPCNDALNVDPILKTAKITTKSAKCTTDNIVLSSGTNCSIV